MRLFITTAVGLGLGMLALPGIALADVTVSPSVVRPGSNVEVWASCSPGVVGAATISAGSSAMQQIDITLSPASDGARGSFTAPDGTTNLGNWTVTATCSGAAAGTTTLTISPSGGAQGGDGGSSDSGTLIATGIALLAAAVAGAYVLKHRAKATA